MPSTKTILITAASGKIGSHLVPLLLAEISQPKLILPSTNAGKLRSALPSLTAEAEEKVIIPEGTVQDPVWFESLLKEHQVDTVFLCLTGTDEMYTALNCLDGISRAPTVRKLVYLSVIGDFTSEAGFRETVRTRGYPHLFSKILMEHRLIHAPFQFEWTVLGPTVFFNGDYMQKANMMQKGELQSLSEHGVNKISLSDIALAARNAMYDSTGEWSGKKVQLGTRRAYDGSETTEIWSKALGKPLKAVYATREAAEDLEQQIRATLPSAASLGTARSVRLVYEYLMHAGMSMSDSEYREQVKLLGKAPDAYESWVEETANNWLRE